VCPPKHPQHGCAHMDPRHVHFTRMRRVCQSDCVYSHVDPVHGVDSHVVCVECAKRVNLSIHHQQQECGRSCLLPTHLAFTNAHEPYGCRFLFFMPFNNRVRHPDVDKRTRVILESGMRSQRRTSWKDPHDDTNQNTSSTLDSSVSRTFKRFSLKLTHTHSYSPMHTLHHTITQTHPSQTPHTQKPQTH
jgi:hypothetical protein